MGNELGRVLIISLIILNVGGVNIWKRKNISNCSKPVKTGARWQLLSSPLVALTAATTTGHADTTTPVAEPQTTATVQTDQAAATATNTTTTNATNNQQSNVDYRTPVNNGCLDGAASDGQNNVVFTGWHATNQYQQGMNHFVIVLDGNNHELYRTTVNEQDRPDVQRVYPNAPISGKGGFSVKVPESRLFNTNTLQLVSRYTNDKNGEPNGGADFWFPKIQTKAGWLDQFKATGNQITVAGWHADDASAKEGTHYLILFDRTKNREIARQVVKNVASDDVAKVYPRIANANKARFTASFAINPSMLNNDDLVLISRYSDPQNVNTAGRYSDYWLNNVVRLNNNKAGYLDNFYVDGINNRVVVSGWHADGRSTLDTNHFLILFDQTANREVGRQKVNVTASNDVAVNGYGNISNADHCRCNLQRYTGNGRSPFCCY